MNTFDPKNLDLKTLIGLAKLTVPQAIKWIDHYNYQLRDSEVIILSNNLNFIGSGKLIEIDTLGKISFKEDGGAILHTHIGIGENVLIIFKEGKATFAVFSE